MKRYLIGTAAIFLLSSLVVTAADGVPKPGSLLAFRITADAKRDADAVAKALDTDGLKKPPTGYPWVSVGPDLVKEGGAFVLRRGSPGTEPAHDVVLVKLDSADITERDLRSVEKSTDERSRPALAFRFKEGAGDRFAALTRAHLPENDGLFKYKLAIIVEGVALSAPSINNEIRDSGIIEFGRSAREADVDRLVRLLKAAAKGPTP